MSGTNGKTVTGSADNDVDSTIIAMTENVIPKNYKQMDFRERIK